MAEALSDYQFTVGAILFVWNYISFEFDDLTHGRRLVRGVGGIERNSSRLTVCCLVRYSLMILSSRKYRYIPGCSNIEFFSEEQILW